MSKRVEVKIKRDIQVDTLRGHRLPKGKQFTHINPFYSPKNGGTAIYGYYDIDEIVQFINDTPAKHKKEDFGFLKGIYKGGTTGADAVRNSDFLFYDIDIKNNNENKELYFDKQKRALLFNSLKKYSAFIGRSNSGTGMFGAFNVKGLARISDTTIHREVAVKIYEHIERELKDKGITVTLDVAQGKYRQVRFIAHQKEKISKNENPVTFSFNITERELKLAVGVPDFKFSRGTVFEGGIRDNFNKANPIETMLTPAGLILVSGNRYKYVNSESPTSGELKDGVYINNSTTFSNNTYFDSFALGAKALNKTLKQMYKHAYDLGFRDAEVDVDSLKEQSKGDNNVEQIFEICYPMKFKVIKEKLNFVDSLELDNETKDIYRAYLGLKKLNIDYDETLKIDRWVSEVSNVIFDRADSEKKIIVVSETGTGKSTAILNTFRELRPDKRLLFIAPLTAIVDQLGDSDDEDIVKLKGGSPEKAYIDAHTASIVIATHEQAIKMLGYKSGFDYVVKDEIHSDIVGSSFKSPVISKLNHLLRDYNVPVIGLTGTPLNIFKSKGLEFYLIKIDSGKAPNKVIQRTDNRQALKTILQHQKGVKGKAFYRANSKDSLKAVKQELVKSGYKYNEILILQSSKEVKMGEDFSRLVETSNFREDIKIVLTTSVIDEGVSIKNTDFTDIVFIDGSYHPRPEPLKQFLNRFRNAGENTKYYFYRHTPEKQDYRQYTDIYDSDIELLEDEILDLSHFDYTKHRTLFSNDRYYNKDGTINYYYLAYKVTKDFFSVMNNAEFNDYIEKNYNIEIIEDFNYKPEDIEIKKQTTLEKKKERTTYWDSMADDLKTVVVYNTSNKDLAQEFGADALTDINKIDEREVRYVKENIDYYEGILAAELAIKNLVEDEYADQFLRDKSGLLDSTRKINRKIAFLKTQRTIEEDIRFTRDLKAKERIVEFIDKIKACREPPTRFEIDKILKRQGVLQQTAHNYVISDIITANTQYMYDGTHNKYVSKEDNPERKSKLIEEWMLPILNPENIRQKSATQLIIQFKN